MPCCRCRNLPATAGVSRRDQRLLREEIDAGFDELGVLLMGHKKGAYWYGSQLGIEETRKLCPHNNATSLQVNAPFMAAIIWALTNPRPASSNRTNSTTRRMLEHVQALPRQPWSAPTPTGRRSPAAAACFRTTSIASDPWQFRNFRVS